MRVAISRALLDKITADPDLTYEEILEALLAEACSVSARLRTVQRTSRATLAE